MSSKCDPRAPFDVWLSVFDDVPADERPTFRYRRTSYAEMNRIAEISEEMRNASDFKASRVKIIEAAAIGLIGWSNQVDVETGDAIPFDKDALAKVINHLEADELLGRRADAAHLSRADKKKSDSPA